MSRAMTFTVRLNVASPAASATLPQFQLALAAGKPVTVTALYMDQEASTTSAGHVIELVSSTATAPGTLTAGNAVVVNNDPSNPAHGFTLTSAGFSGSLTGTQTTLLRRGRNVLMPFEYNPIPENMFEIAAGGFLWVRLPVVVAATYNIELTVMEEG